MGETADADQRARGADAATDVEKDPARNRAVFVGASPRSGTTLFRSMLHAHPELAVPRESRFLLGAYEKRAEFGDPRLPETRERIAHWILKRKGSRSKRFELDVEEAIRRMVEGPPTLGSMLAVPFVMYAENHGARRWGDKRPTYVQHTDTIFRLFPRTQFINMVRDPRAVVASMRKLGWFKGNVPAAVELWLRSIRHADRARRRLGADEFYEIRYEDLVVDPEAVALDVCRFLDIDEARAGEMLEFHDDVDVPANRYHWRVSEPITTVALRGWESTLDDEEVAFVEAKTKTVMERYGYEPSVAGVAVPSTLQKRFTRRRGRVLLGRARESWDETRRRLRYRYPVENRLDAG